MKIIDADAKLIDPFRETEITQHIEKCGRVCYKSESKIGKGTDSKFISGIISRGHEAVLEHGSFIFRMNYACASNLEFYIRGLERHGYPCYLKMTECRDRFIVSGNVRAWRDFIRNVLSIYDGAPRYLGEFVLSNPLLFPEWQTPDTFFAYTPIGSKFEQIGVGDLRYDTELDAHWNLTAQFICDRGVSHEIVRHRPASYCQESTRYCNYSKDGFSGQVTFIRPNWMVPGTTDYKIWSKACQLSENAYFDLLTYGSTPQEARTVLNNSLKTELVMTATLGEWKHFFNLRTSKAAHPQMREVAEMLKKEFQSLLIPVDSEVKDATV